MKKGMNILVTALKKTAYNLLLFATFLLGVAVFVSLPLLFDLGKKPGEHLGFAFDRLTKEMKNVLIQMMDYKSHSFIEYATSPQVLDGFLHSYTILSISLVIIILAGSAIAYAVMLSPYSLRKILRTFLDLFEGLPDLIFIFIINMLIIYLYQEYNIKLLTMYGLGSNQPIVFPVILISFLPSILFGVFLLKSMEDEEQELYILVGFSKGLTKGYLYTVHMIRNVLPVFALKFRSILYMLLSNLVLVEFMYFYDQAHTSILLMHLFMGDHVLLLLNSIMMLVLPVIILESLIRLIVKYTVLRKRGEIQL
jgi:peptide/nickel transport system permease protein